jgi:hypothetical protein
MIYHVNTAGNEEERSSSDSQRARTEKVGKVVPPRSEGRYGDKYGIANDAFGFELGADRNPDAVGRSNFRRNAFGGNDDGGEVGQQILTMGTASEMLASLEGERTKPV